MSTIVNYNGEQIAEFENDTKILKCGGKVMETDVEIFSEGTAGTTDHSQLLNRDAANQHPMSAITGLQSALDAKGTYSKPSSGIPKTDLASAVQTSLGLADTALQSHQDISGKLNTNGDGSNVTAAFTQASTRANIATGEKLSVIFGKIAKWFADLKTVAFSGSYNDLSNKPTIPTVPTNVSAFNNDAGYLTSHQSLSAYRTASAQDTIDAGKEAKTNKVTSISASSTDTQYPSAKAVYTYIASLDGNGVSY